MKRAEIEAKIAFVERKFGQATNSYDLKVYGKLLERLIMMESDEEREAKKNQGNQRPEHG